jgi:hypothetical protein
LFFVVSFDVIVPAIRDLPDVVRHCSHTLLGLPHVFNGVAQVCDAGIKCSRLSIENSTASIATL